MTSLKKLSNPFATGGGGVFFESHVQACFIVLMLSGGHVPCLPNGKISKIKLQAKFANYHTDDLVVFIKQDNSSREVKLLAQIKHTISITSGSKIFGEVINAAWADFNNKDIFNDEFDAIALITGPLTASDTGDVRTILEWARHAESAAEFFKQVNLSRFSSNAKRAKLGAFRSQLKSANDNIELNQEQLFQFLRKFHLLGYDLDIKSGVTLALLHSLIGLYSSDNIDSLWGRLVSEAQSFNQNSGTITVDNLPRDLVATFKKKLTKEIPSSLTIPMSPRQSSSLSNREQLMALAAAALLGSWDEGNECDQDIVRSIVDGF